MAGLSGDEGQGQSIIRALAGSQNPYTSMIQGAASNATTAGPQSVSTTRAIDNVPGQGAAGSTQDYMDPYLQSVLAPQLRMQDENAIRQQNALDARATMGGAFGDARSGFEAAQNTRDSNNLRNDTVGKAYSQAFADAMNRKGIDLSRLLDVDKTNAGLSETALTRGLTGGAALQGLDKYDTGRSADLASLLSQGGATQRGLDQAKLDAQYAEFSKKTGFPLELSKAIMSAINGTPYSKSETGTNTGTQTGSTFGTGATTSTGSQTGTSATQGTQIGSGTSHEDSTISKPDNSGFGILTALLGAALAPATGGASLAGSLGSLLKMPNSDAGWFGGSPESNPAINPASWGNIAATIG